MKVAIAVMLAIFVAGCGGPSLTMSVRAGSPAAATATASPSRALVAGTGIELTRVRLVIRRVELKKAGTTEMTEVASGPYLLDLSGASLDGNVTKVLDASSFTPGAYDEIRFELHKADSTDVGVNASLADMIAAQASLIADGTIDGASFSFVTAVTAQQSFTGAMPLEDGSNLTLNVDASSWFTVNGTRLDPRNEQNRSQIENNIQSSFKAFKDDNHDGQPDP
jgi:hypothetical protein